MSQSSSSSSSSTTTTTSSPSSFQLLFNAALQDYAKQIGTKLEDHPIVQQLKNCDLFDSISSILQEHAQRFQEFQGKDAKIMKSLKHAVHILYTLSNSTALGEGIGIVSPKSLPFSVPHVHPIAIPAGQSHICCLHYLAYRRPLSAFPCIYPCDT